MSKTVWNNILITLHMLCLFGPLIGRINILCLTNDDGVFHIQVTEGLGTVCCGDGNVIGQEGQIRIWSRGVLHAKVDSLWWLKIWSQKDIITSKQKEMKHDIN